MPHLVVSGAHCHTDTGDCLVTMQDGDEKVPPAGAEPVREVPGGWDYDGPRVGDGILVQVVDFQNVSEPAGKKRIAPEPPSVTLEPLEQDSAGGRGLPADHAGNRIQREVGGRDQILVFNRFRPDQVDEFDCQALQDQPPWRVWIQLPESGGACVFSTRA